MNNSQYQDLIRAAAAARDRAYAPYSKFHVGAALLTASGEVFQGCNVENASYGLAICAERNAICQAVANGLTDFEAIAVVAHPLASPCGACRQFIVEFGKQIQVVCANAEDLEQIQSWSIEDLIPESFDGKSLP